jgi:hypothetical protein
MRPDAAHHAVDELRVLAQQARRVGIGEKRLAQPLPPASQRVAPAPEDVVGRGAALRDVPAG